MGLGQPYVDMIYFLLNYRVEGKNRVNIKLKLKDKYHLKTRIRLTLIPILGPEPENLKLQHWAMLNN